jgi:protein disulfide-isomerase
LALIVVLLASLSLGAGKRPLTAKTNPWQVSYDGALRQSRTLKKPILMCFVGSDWCMDCMHLVKETLSSGEFAAWAANNVVMLVVDFPKETPQSPQVKKQNQALKDKYNVKGYPNMLLLSSTGEVIDRFAGYHGKEKWQKRLQEAMEKVETKPRTKAT